MKKHLVAAVAIFITMLLVTPSVHALTTPSFPSCLNPQGTLKVKYDNGEHGIVGKQGTFSGSDAVYITSDSTYTQCFCPLDGNGVQTNWWKFSDLDPDEIKSLTYNGWTLIHDGSLWGLTADQYLATNTSYSCLARGGGNGGSGGSSNSSGGSGGGSSSSSNNGISGIGGGEILGLAFTGDVIVLYGLVVIGAISLLTGAVMERKFMNE